jgi:hypothetical protein
MHIAPFPRTRADNDNKRVKLLINSMETLHERLVNVIKQFIRSKEITLHNSIDVFN